MAALRALIVGMEPSKSADAGLRAVLTAMGNTYFPKGPVPWRTGEQLNGLLEQAAKERPEVPSFKAFSFEPTADGKYIAGMAREEVMKQVGAFIQMLAAP